MKQSIEKKEGRLNLKRQGRIFKKVKQNKNKGENNGKQPENPYSSALLVHLFNLFFYFYFFVYQVWEKKWEFNL